MSNSERQLTGGKSGSSVFVINDNGTKKIKKVFDTRKLRELEYDLHVEMYNVFQNADYKPVVIPYGTLSPITGGFGFLMEYLDEKEYVPLAKYIADFCGKRKQNQLTNIDYVKMNVVLKELFNYITAIKINGLSHCDLHVGNIFVNTSNPNPRVKIIDFGLSKHQWMPCDKSRSITESIYKSFGPCVDKSINILKLGKFLDLVRKQDSDLSMLATIVSILYSKQSKAIGQLYKISTKLTKHFNGPKPVTEQLRSDIITLMKEYLTILERIFKDEIRF